MDLHTWLIGALHGRRKALFTIYGGALGFVIMIALSVFGIGALLQASLVQACGDVFMLIGAALPLRA